MTENAAKAQTVKSVCDSLLDADFQRAADTARNGYPFAPAQFTGRVYTETQCTAIFIRDGFIDRYSGTQLIFPGTIRLLSRLLPAEFPFHPQLEDERNAHDLLGAVSDGRSCCANRARRRG